MAQSSFFGKRSDPKVEPVATPAAPAATPASAATVTPPSATPAGARPAGFFGASATGAAAAPAFNSTAGSDDKSRAEADAAADKESKLTVGPNIKLKGVEITDCDVLFIEGIVEATLDSKVIQISENGSFNGTANIDVAEIHGSFDGDLTVRDKLTVFATGKVTGKIRYGKLVVEEGARISGEISSASN